MTEAAILLLDLQPPARDLVDKAARSAFREVSVRSFDRLEEAIQSDPGANIEILVVSSTHSSTPNTAWQADDSGGLPRWAVLDLSESGTTDIPLGAASDERDFDLLVHQLRGVASHQRLRRENARLAGDLKTIAHRISHDLRAPLGVLLSAGEVMKEIAGDDSPSGGDLLKSVSDSVDELERHIRRVSHLIRATLNPPKKTPVQVAEIVWAVLQRMERRIVETRVLVSQPPSWPEVSGVPQFLETIWANLLANSVEHGKGLSRLDLGWELEDDGFRFWVCDDGCGVPSHKAAVLFRPFHRLHCTDSCNGLGLSIVQRLVELQGGRCGYRANAHAGSYFYFTLPRDSVQP